MPALGQNIDYEVTISEDLRALLRARRSSETKPSRCGERAGPPTGEPGRGVFSRLRLRIDGSRPARIRASEILALCVGGQGNGNTMPCQDSGWQRLSILMTEDGRCMAHLVAEPPAGTPARPVHRLRQVRRSDDVTAMVKDCHANLLSDRASTVGAQETNERLNLLKSQSTQMTEVVKPFVATLCQ